MCNMRNMQIANECSMALDSNISLENGKLWTTGIVNRSQFSKPKGYPDWKGRIMMMMILFIL